MAAANGFARVVMDVGGVAAAGTVAAACVVHLDNGPKKKKLLKSIDANLTSIADATAERRKPAFKNEDPSVEK